MRVNSMSDSTRRLRFIDCSGMPHLDLVHGGKSRDQ